MVGSATRLFVLTFGAELVTKGLSVRNAGAEPFWSPISGALVETSEAGYSSIPACDTIPIGRVSWTEFMA